MKNTIHLPQKVKVIKKEGNRVVFEIGGCYPGYGMTLGNVFRRVLLSSLSGVAITSVKIKGASHEFSTIPYVLEDVIQIILNLKQIRFKINSEETLPIKVELKVAGEKEVKAKDIKTTSELEIINKDTHIATLTDKKAKLEMEIEIDGGMGYVPVEQRKKEKLEIGAIAIDASMVPAMIPWVGDVVSDVIEDLHFAELRKSLTPSEYDDFIKQDKVAPATIAMMRALAK